jgi:peroxin-1
MSCDRSVSLSLDAPALLLSTDTEVSVAPKLRQKPSDKEREKFGPRNSTTKDTASKENRPKPQVLRLRPSRLVPGLPDPRLADGESDGMVAFVSHMTMTTLLGLGYLPFDGFVEHEFASSPTPSSPLSQESASISHSKYLLRARIHRLRPPIDPTDPSSKLQPPPSPNGTCPPSLPPRCKES